jgi:hypothetical protein
METDGDHSVVSCRVTVSLGDGARSVRALFRGALPYEPGSGDATIAVLLSEQAARFTRTPWPLAARTDRPPALQLDLRGDLR